MSVESVEVKNICVGALTYFEKNLKIQRHSHNEVAEETFAFVRSISLWIEKQLF